ncbi:NAD(P)/FAD-dependent oxidoreductase [Lujinxingia sediminis]|uniref:NAD(P)/FAD-dependent oxidoreductase n=1 Tax=Lujinxingia sediminis TaxID=2480984 RepID=A0ABY0CWQ8_9DELT|nr:NAD(P)/FAD-dependent oxidoreductase [Lujinxingia sediminis]RVU48322.1 NAD(P)/FAD-dependent oxidoreductase [Lujinxingia sediminis]
MSMIETNLDVLIIGGGPASLSAALYLGRARRRALVVDAGGPRHAPSAGVHNFLTREGVTPAGFRELAWADLQEFPTLSRVEARVVEMSHDGTRWSARTESGATLSARAVLLAVGVVDVHPDIPGYAERWAKSIHHCPFCHGWEVRDRPVAMVGKGDYARHMAPMLKNWTDDVIVLSHGEPFDEDTQKVLDALKVPFYASPIVGLEGEDGTLETILLQNGTRLARQGLFVKPGQRQHDLIHALGLPLKGDPLPCVEVDAMQRTSLPLLWAAGDCTTGFQQVLEAAASGARAAASIIMTLTFSTD